MPFPAVGGNLSFCNVTPSLIHAGTTLAILDDSTDALLWTERLVERWQQGRDPDTGLCGGQLSYRNHDRAQDALGHVHRTINEAKIVASYHQISRYHRLPLVQIQAAEALRRAGGASRHKFAQRLIDTASDDLKTYARKSSGMFPRSGYEYARTGDDVPFALLHLAGALSGRQEDLPAPVYDTQFFHCQYHGKLEEHQKKRADSRTYDHYVFYGSR